MDDLAPATEAHVEQGETREPRVPVRMFALKDADTFVVADASGDILGAGDGFFHNDTRMLSRWRLLLGPAPPKLLSAAVAADDVFFTAHLSNQALPFPGGGVGPPGVLHVERKRFLWDERLYERVAIVNYSRDPVMVPLAFEFGADFHDMFEVRGARRRGRGVRRATVLEGRGVRFGYDGLDGLARTTVVAFSDTPARLSQGRAEFMYSLGPEGRLELYAEVGAPTDDTPSCERYRAAAARALLERRRTNRRGAKLSSSSRLFNAWLEKSRADVSLLVTATDWGPYPYAGIPWFSTAFGRDAVITAWQVLWLDPGLARGVLRYLAAHQAQETSAFRDSAPGKIMHETRKCEMANLGEVPFARYYGGVDTTPLFVALAGAYADRTGDYALIDELWPALTRAIGWVEQFEDGFIAYARGAASGLANQGWKDSEDSVFHKNGRFPPGPIALVEVQGYAYAAFLAMGGFARRRGDDEAAERWCAQAERVRDMVEARFWMEAEGFYGIAIDGEGRLCETLTSNPGHLLFTGLPSQARAKRVAERLLSKRFNSGWGLRTLAEGQARYNPMSYHNGSVWPHDTAICAAGLARYGERARVVQLMDELFETAANFDMRLPELFCGFPRTSGEPPVAYPVACLPQAWAAGSCFMMLQACLGLRIDGEHGRIELLSPHLPAGLDRLAIRHLEVGGRRVDLVLEAAGRTCEVHTRGEVDVSVI
ncbi:glycogen debranching N-terminal domain-containing protein [Phenylobacterium terrae]|uniref:Glycogen debranching N-terminal domain-containing protein n=1 Tax=Phenylobacterium terrae TaxID=2665495 RepID=A0ABW4N4S5_9CAUL